MTKRIFISYRRDDSAGHAGRVFDRLKVEFGHGNLFMDVDAIPLGVNFVKYLGEQVGKCDVLLAIIGPAWLTLKHDDGSRRLDNPNDLVRVEIAAALARDIPVIPILLEGTRVPKAETLPQDLQELSQRHGLDVRHASFHADMDKLVKGLKCSPAPPKPRKQETATTYTVPPKPVVAADEVIAARGVWLRAFAVDERSENVPIVFPHFFMKTTHTSVEVFQTAGTIMIGAKWGRAAFFSIAHGWCGAITAMVCESPSFLTYLGPEWRPEFADLSAAVFKKLGAKPLSHFMTYPSKTAVPVKK